MTQRVRRGTRMPRPIQRFLQVETSGGLALLVAAIVAVALANSPARSLYQDVLAHELTLGIGRFALTLSVAGWVNDALMTIFFFVVGLEIKRELVEGELRDPRTATLPVIAAAGGMIVPALIFLALNLGETTQRGWGIPIATDIAFAVGVLALLGPRVPSALKIFLLTLAIADDVGGIFVIALFYTDTLSVVWLFVAVGGLALVVVLRRLGVGAISAYLAVGVFVWFATYESGVHATIAGVALGLMTPAAPVAGRRVLQRIEQTLHPWARYGVIPLFALANAGVEVSGQRIGAALTESLTWGIVLGLVVGKTVGVTAFAIAADRLKIGRLPAGMSGRHVVGAGALAGIGFTVAIFIANLSFGGAPELLENAKMGVLIASLVSATLGVSWLVFFSPRPIRPEMAAEPG